MDTIRMKLGIETWKSILPPSSLNTIIIDLHDMIEELLEDEDGIVIDMESYLVPYVHRIKFQFHSLVYLFPRHIVSQKLHEFNVEPQHCQILSEIISLEYCSSLHGPGPFLLWFNVRTTTEVRVFLDSFTFPFEGASDYVLRRLVEEQIVKEEEGSCSICIEDFSTENHKNVIIQLPNCLHLFHQDCIFDWLKRRNSCPLCRRVPYDEEHETEI